MAVANIKAVIPCDIKKVWEAVTSLEHYSWRSDLGKIETVDENKFVEFTKDGFSTSFVITYKEPLKRMEFDMENANMRGHWIGLFSEDGENTTVDFTEDVTAKKLFMKLFVGMYLKRQQAVYISDLKKALK